MLISSEQAKPSKNSSVPEAISFDVFITSHDPHTLVTSFTADYSYICKKRARQSILSLLPPFYLSLIPFSVYIYVPNSPSALAQALVIAGSLLNSHNALL